MGMKVTQVCRPPKETTYEDLEMGATFIYAGEDKPSIKLRTNRGHVDLETGHSFYNTGGLTEKVIRVKAETTWWIELEGPFSVS